jgi:hypothetical protein
MYKSDPNSTASIIIDDLDSLIRAVGLKAA